MSRFDDDEPTVERGAAILLALQKYARGDGDYAELLSLLAQPAVMSRVAKSGAAIRTAYAWLCALVERELPLELRARARGSR